MSIYMFIFRRYRNAFVNLALPLVQFSEPMPAAKVAMNRGKSFTLWDRFEIHADPELTLAQFFEHFEKQEHLRVNMLSCGSSVLYTSFMPKKDRLKMTMSAVVELVQKRTLPQDQTSLTFEICCVDVDDEDKDVDCPSVKYTFKRA